MKILIAPNAFKGTLTAGEAAAAIKKGLVMSRMPCTTVLCPVADGGDGLIEVMRRAVGGRLMFARVSGPLGRKVKARWLLKGKKAFIEMAEASGLKRCAGRLRPMEAGTIGVGELIKAALRRGADEIYVGLGGSASNDGGAGCASALGFSLLDERGRPVSQGVGGLIRLASITAPRKKPVPEGARVFGLSDVSNKLCGRSGSARVFGPQKGAGPGQVSVMERALVNYAAVIKKSLGLDVLGLKGGAAAGGLGAGLYAFLGAGLLGGSDYVFEAVSLAENIRKCDLVITGEGMLDSQTFHGKAPGKVAEMAFRAGKPVIFVCGRSRLRGPLIAKKGRALAIEAPSGGTSPAEAAGRISAAVSAFFSGGKSALRAKGLIESLL